MWIFYCLIQNLNKKKGCSSLGEQRSKTRGQFVSGVPKTKTQPPKPYYNIYYINIIFSCERCVILSLFNFLFRGVPVFNGVVEKRLPTCETKDYYNGNKETFWLQSWYKPRKSKGKRNMFGATDFFFPTTQQNQLMPLLDGLTCKKRQKVV